MKNIHRGVNSFRFACRPGATDSSRASRDLESEAMTSISSMSEAATELADTFSGQLLKPKDAGYDEARRVHNGLIDKRPALIARCRSATDVVSAVNLTQRFGLEAAVRGGGHNVAGRATIDGG